MLLKQQRNIELEILLHLIWVQPAKRISKNDEKVLLKEISENTQSHKVFAQCRKLILKRILTFGAGSILATQYSLPAKSTFSPDSPETLLRFAKMQLPQRHPHYGDHN